MSVRINLGLASTMKLKIKPIGGQTCRLLVDNEGQVWEEGSYQLRERLFCLSYPGDLTADVIRNLGYIGIRAYATGLHVQLRLEHFSEAALGSVLYWLSDHKPEKVYFDYAGQNSGEFVGGASAAIEKLIALGEAAALRRQIDATHLDVSKLNESSPLNALLNYWLAHKGICESQELAQIADQHLASRFLSIKPLNDARDYRISNVGDGILIPDAHWLKTARGKAIREQPDTTYFRWVVSTYDTALTSGRPDLANVTASIFWPAKGWVKRKYTRLLLPCAGREGLHLFSANSTQGQLTAIGA